MLPMLPVSNVANDQLGLGSGIVNRNIKPGTGDWVGIGAGRLASLKRANNITRDAFMKAVADMFGGVGSIPDNVKEAMKLEDYGKGRMLYLSPYEPQGAKLDKREMHIRAHALVDWALGHSHDHLEAWP